MAASPPVLRGAFAGHRLAASFAREVHRVHRRYAAEVVAAERLCPHLRNVDEDFGTFVVMLDPAPSPDLEATLDAVRAAASPVMHIVFPLVRPPAADFERFGGRVAQGLRRTVSPTPVLATFHPELAGDDTDPHRLIGLLRRAPDPFVQLIPAGYQGGGTVLVQLPPPGQPMPSFEPQLDWPQRNFDKLRGEGLARLQALQADIHADRDRSYAPFLAAFADLAQPA